MKVLKMKERNTMDRRFKENFIDFMIESGVLRFGDFQTKSGRMSPYFINTGNYSSGAKISTLGSFYAKLIKEKVSTDILKSGNLCLFGPAYKGIPLAVASSSALYQDFGINVPYSFNRKEDKDHGEKGLLVGHSFKAGQSILIVEDVITAGTALREVIPFLNKQENVRIEGVVVSVDRMEKGKNEKSAVQEIQEEYGIPVFPMVTINDILEILRDNKESGEYSYLNESVKKIEAYLKEYGTKAY